MKTKAKDELEKELMKSIIGPKRDNLEERATDYSTDEEMDEKLSSFRSTNEHGNRRHKKNSNVTQK